MEKYDLLKSQKNDLFRLLTEYELNPHDFNWEDSSFEFEGNNLSKTISFINTEYYFHIFVFGDRIFNGEYSPGENHLIEKYSAPNWSDLLYIFENWLRFLNKEINQPDLWERINEFQLPGDVRLNRDQDNSKFNNSEVMQIKAGLDNLKEYFKTQLSLEKDQFTYISENIDYLVESSKNQGRKSFYYTIIGNLVTIITALSIGTEHGKAIWGIVKSMFLGLVKALPN